MNDEYWENVALSDLTADGPDLLAFYPMDGDFRAMYIWNELRDRAWDDDEVTIVGPRKELQQEVYSKTEKYGVTSMILPVFGGGGENPLVNRAKHLVRSMHKN